MIGSKRHRDDDEVNCSDHSPNKRRVFPNQRIDDPIENHTNEREKWALKKVLLPLRTILHYQKFHGQFHFTHSYKRFQIYRQVQNVFLKKTKENFRFKDSKTLISCRLLVRVLRHQCQPVRKAREAVEAGSIEKINAQKRKEVVSTRNGRRNIKRTKKIDPRRRKKIRNWKNKL